MSRFVPRAAHLTTALVAVVLTVGSAGCGDDDVADGSTPASTPTTPAATTPAAAPTTPADDASSADRKAASDDKATGDKDANESAAGDSAATGDRPAAVRAALEDAGFKVEKAPVVEPATAVLKVGAISVVFYGKKSEAVADAEQFQKLFEETPDQGIARQVGRRVYFVTATAGKLTAQQRSDFTKIVKISEAAQS